MKTLNIFLLVPSKAPADYEGNYFDDLSEFRAEIESTRSSDKVDTDEVALVNSSDDADISVVVLIDQSGDFLREIVELSQSNVSIWCFAKRSVMVDQFLADQINSRRPFQTIYSYDSFDDVLRMIYRTVRDRSVKNTVTDQVLR